MSGQVGWWVCVGVWVCGCVGGWVGGSVGRCGCVGACMRGCVRARPRARAHARAHACARVCACTRVHVLSVGDLKRDEHDGHQRAHGRRAVDDLRQHVEPVAHEQENEHVNMHHATCNMQHATCSMQHAICNMSTCNLSTWQRVHSASDIPNRTRVNMQHATCNMQHATCSMQHAESCPVAWLRCWASALSE